MKKYKAVFFDLDGTLLDTIGDLGEAMNNILAKYNLKGYTSSEYKLMVGHGVKSMTTRAFGGRGLSYQDEYLKLFVEEYRNHCVVKTAPYPGVEELLEQLSRAGIPMGVVTNKAEELAWKISSTILGAARFSFFRGGRDDCPLKPDPSGVLMEAEKLKIDPVDVLFLGDSGVDMRTAVNAGMYPCGVSWGFRSREELTEAGSQKIIDSPVDLAGMIV